MPDTTPASPLVYGYIRTAVERSEYLRECQEALAQWCAWKGFILGGTFTDVGMPLDAENRIGFSGLIQALSMPTVSAAVILDSKHLATRAEVVTSLVAQIRRTGSALWMKDGELPTAAQQHRSGQVEP
jgi:hypothetical protein